MFWAGVVVLTESNQMLPRVSILGSDQSRALQWFAMRLECGRSGHRLVRLKSSAVPYEASRQSMQNAVELQHFEPNLHQIDYLRSCMHMCCTHSCCLLPCQQLCPLSLRFCPCDDLLTSVRLLVDCCFTASDNSTTAIYACTSAACTAPVRRERYYDSVNSRSCACATAASTPRCCYPAENSTSASCCVPGMLLDVLSACLSCGCCVTASTTPTANHVRAQQLPRPQHLPALLTAGPSAAGSVPAMLPVDLSVCLLLLLLTPNLSTSCCTSLQ